MTDFLESARPILPAQTLSSPIRFAQTVKVAIASLIASLSLSIQPAVANPSCPAALDQVQSYRVATGDTLASVAATYRLQPATLQSFNPGITDSLAAGNTLRVPPFNGRAVSVAAGESWQTLAERYGARADLLFEINGCVAEVPNRIFIPGVMTTATRPAETVQLPGYPLDQPASIALSYGWQPSASRDELVFNSGIAFAIPTAREVRTVDSGTVAFVGDREDYGQLVVVNHARGLQTRYANLNNVAVSVGQTVTADTPLGSVGGEEPTFLYFEVRTNSDSGWVAQDPGKYLPALELR